jgi:dipeptidyl aminopeptidase/acylaminoacyl peptidase
MYPSYQMFDPGLEADIKGVQNALSASSVYLDSWSSDWSKLLFFVDGGARAERYILLDRATKKLTAVANARPEITQADVGEVITIEYKSRDGLTIPGLVTWPTGVAAADRNNLPLIVMPHGGPKAFDSVGFDWLAQYLANEGYAVLQPNFRGSTGFGASFAQAGYGEWGRKMQDDITDGANALVKMGWADPQRICIVGWSYGGYAALAGGALTPDLYKCVASIAGVSNLRDMILDARKRYGPNSRSVTYWELLIGDLDKEGDAIDAVSPSRLADRFKAPVLLIHGESDTTVPVRQSDVMNDALRSAKKNVRYVRIPGDDHGLVDNASRRQALTELGAFLKANIGK